MGQPTDPKKPAPSRPSGSVSARVVGGLSTARELRFGSSFVIGSGAGCDLRVLGATVADQHAHVLFDGLLWWVRDLGSERGTYVDGNRVQVVPLRGQLEIELGKGGPHVQLGIAQESAPARLPEVAPRKPAAGSAAGPAKRSDTAILESFIQHSDRRAGTQTMMMVREAIVRSRKKWAHKYVAVVAVALVGALTAGSVIAYQQKKLSAQRQIAEELFYQTKSVELQILELEDQMELVFQQANPAQAAKLKATRAKYQEMEKRYDAFVQECLYNRIPKDERVIRRVARAFGECDVNVPPEFVAEVKKYIQKFKANDSFPRLLAKGKQKYAATVAREFKEKNLPPQYLYLALKESHFDERAVGPPTRYGYAKGMWQFISLTAHDYGLQIGPLFDKDEYDEKDDRFNWKKETHAAARYIRHLNATDAQASGLLAMASYNWGEGKVRASIQAMPENVRERNFWRLLSAKNVPAETYDYVLSIFTMAVICEDPHLFGFDVECPLGGIGGVSGPEEAAALEPEVKSAQTQ
jgi:membrane-bound lytic murein transglycosylase D